MQMNEMCVWREIKLGDFIEVISGYAFKSSDFLDDLVENALPVLKITNIANGDVHINGAKYHLYNEKLSKYIARKGDVLMALTGNHPQVESQVVGLTSRYKLNQISLINQRVANISIVNEQELDKDFLYYFLKDKSTHQYIASQSTGSANQANISKVDVENIPLQIPPLPEQQSIASVLSSLDDKIDLLHRQNATLEKMAETLFRQWFLEETKEDWEEIKLGNIVEVINGVSYKSDDLNSSTTAMVTLKSFDRNGGFRMDGFKEYTGKFKEQHILKEGDLVVAHTDITQEADVIGNPVMVIGNPKYEILVFSMDLVKVCSKDEKYSNEFLYLLMKSREFKEHCLGYSNGSTVLHLSKKAIPEYEMKLPPNKLINEFSINVKPLVQKQFRNQTQIRILTTLRDTLLPKLMSGEVRVKV